MESTTGRQWAAAKRELWFKSLLLAAQTAEMPDMYKKGEYDLAGFAVGSVDEDRLIDGKSVAAGDLVLGLASSGVHSNGFSLVHKILQVCS